MRFLKKITIVSILVSSGLSWEFQSGFGVPMTLTEGPKNLHLANLPKKTPHPITVKRDDNTPTPTLQDSQGPVAQTTDSYSFFGAIGEALSQENGEWFKDIQTAEPDASSELLPTGLSQPQAEPSPNTTSTSPETLPAPLNRAGQISPVDVKTDDIPTDIGDSSKPTESSENPADLQEPPSTAEAPKETTAAPESSTPNQTSEPATTTAAPESNAPNQTSEPTTTTAAPESSTPNQTSEPTTTTAAPESSTPNQTSEPATTTAAPESNAPNQTSEPTTTTAAPESSTPNQTSEPTATTAAPESNAPNQTSEPKTTTAAPESSTPNQTTMSSEAVAVNSERDLKLISVIDNIKASDTVDILALAATIK